MFRKYIFYITMFAAITGIVSCRTNEKNYRQAYEKAVAKNDRGVTEFENTIYNRYRGRVTDVPVELDGKTVDTRMMRVKVTEDGGGINEWLKQYSVVVAEFKQRFNANSLRTRFVDAGYPRAFIVENAEPYYYVLAGSSSSLQDMVSLADSIKANSPLPLKEGFPYIMQIP